MATYVTRNIQNKDIQFDNIAQVRRLKDMIKILDSQYDAKCRAGFKKEAKKEFLPQINELKLKLKNFCDNLNEMRRLSARTMLALFCVCDLATIMADKLGDNLQISTLGEMDKDNGVSNSVKKLAEDFNKIVQLVDTAGHEKMSMFYADMAEEFCDKALPILDEITEKYFDSTKGKQYF